jgi:conjugal transfer pilus assembly protein TraW
MLHFLIALMNCLDFGTYGEAYPIQEEEGFMVVLKKRLKKIQTAFTTSVENPIGTFYPKAKRARSFEFDPSICLVQEVRDHHGNVLLTKGTLVNPLEITFLPDDLLFIDGNDPTQVSWAKQEKGIWILTNGKPLGFELQELNSVYIDQEGYLADKLGVVSVPAKVSQKNKKLLIEEVPCFEI